MKVRTWSEGEVGMSGTRYVLPGGFIEIGGSRGAKHMTTRRRYFDERLKSYVGKLVYFHDGDDLRNRISVYTPKYSSRGRVLADRWIAYASPIKP